MLAPNPGPYTGPGTNTYVVADGGLSVVIDPGPVIESHLTAIEHAVGGTKSIAVLVTHTHPDHAPAANPLAARFGVPAYGFDRGPSFEPDHRLRDGDVVPVGNTKLQVVHTPGHTPDHICYLADGVVFTGDHIMGGSTVIIEDAVDYLASLRKVQALVPAHLYPGHGPEIPDAAAMVNAYIAHRVAREEQIVAAVREGATSVPAIVSVVYAGLDAALVPAAAHQVDVQLQKLAAEGRVTLSADGREGAAVVRLPEVSS